MIENFKSYFRLFFIIVLIYAASRVLGIFFLENNWSFIHPLHIPLWETLFSLLLLIIIPLFLYYYFDKLSSFLNNKFAVPAFIALLFFAIWFFRYDSFVYGDGNIRMNQIAMAPSIFLEWFEFGSLFLISILYKLFSLFSFLNNSLTEYQANLKSAYNSWITFSFVMSFFSLIGSFKIASLISKERFNQLLYTVVIFFGAHSLVLFGLLAIETAVVTFSIWISYFCMKIIYKSSSKDLIYTWILFVLSVSFYFANIYMLPAVIYATIVAKNKIVSDKKKALMPAMLILIVSLFLIYLFAQNNFRFAQFFLTIDGLNPNSDYGLFSTTHISDVFQALFLLFPQIIFIFYLYFKKDSDRENQTFDIKFAAVLSVSGLLALFVMNPIHGFPVDLPRFSAFLAPLSILLALQLSKVNLSVRHNSLVLFVLTALAIALPAGYSGAYNKIDNADGYLESYFEEKPQFYLSGCHAFRDAYFFRKEFSKADQWEWKLPIESQDFLNFRGCTELLASGQDAAALKILYRIIVQHPYWSEVRYQTAQAQLNLNRYELARAQIDTCLIISPYDKEYHILNLQCYQKAADFSGGYDAALFAVALFPKEMDVLTEMMAIQYRRGELSFADSLATIILENDSSIVFPLVIKGFVAEYEERFDEAIAYFELFTTKAREDDPDVPIIRKKLNQLVLKQSNKQQ